MKWVLCDTSVDGVYRERKIPRIETLTLDAQCQKIFEDYLSRGAQKVWVRLMDMEGIASRFQGVW